MSLQEQINQKAGKFLGKNLNDYQTNYNPELLVPIERALNRKDYDITGEEFVGFDIWHNYECSFMTNKGYPVSVVGKVKIPADSKYFVESKSMKLYFFSYHMERLGETVDEAIENYKEMVIRDLSLATESAVEFEVFFDHTSNYDVFGDYQDVTKLVDVDAIEFDAFKESPELLVLSESEDEVKVLFKNVRSNCRVTHQPDFANLFLRISGKRPTIESVLRYIVSFRNEFHFHEEVTEQIFKNIQKRFDVDELAVCMLFTRRGGLDICPCRATHDYLIDEVFADVKELPARTVYQ